MILKDLFSENERIKILDTLFTYYGDCLTLEEISRMTNLPAIIVNKHLKQLKDINIILITEDNKFELDTTDVRVNMLGIIHEEEYLRKRNLL